MTYTKNKRDTNEAEIVEFFHNLGACWVPMDRNAGFDGLLLYRGILHIVEIKMPAERNHLTQAERKRRDEAEERGIAYNVICSVDEAVKLLEAK